MRRSRPRRCRTPRQTSTYRIFRRSSIPGTLVARDATFVNFDLLQSGLGCIDSWGALPEKQFRVPYGDYTFRFMLKPTVK